MNTGERLLYRSALRWTWAAALSFLLAQNVTLYVGFDVTYRRILVLIAGLLLVVAGFKTSRAFYGGRCA